MFWIPDSSSSEEPSKPLPYDKARYRVKVKDGYETHFKYAVRSFDPNILIETLEDGVYILTSMSEADLWALTSVKTLKRIYE